MRRTFLSLYLRWLLVHVLGLPLSYLLGTLLSLALGPETGVLIMATPAMIIGAVVFSYIQWRMLIRISEIRLFWIALSGVTLASLFLIAFWNDNDQKFPAMIGGAVLGELQFLILRKKVVGMLWWIPASVIAWPALFFVYNLVGLSISFFHLSAGAIALLGLIVGAITAIPYAFSFTEVKPPPVKDIGLSILSSSLILVLVLWLPGQSDRYFKSLQPEFESPLTENAGTLLFSPDGRWLAIQDGSGVIIHDIADWGMHMGYEAPEGHFITDFAFSPDNKFFAISSNRESGGHVLLLHLYNLTSQSMKNRDKKDKANTVAFSPDGRWIAIGGGVDNDSVSLWDTTTLTQVREFKVAGAGNETEVKNIDFSADGQVMAVSIKDVQGGRVLVYNTETWGVLHELQISGAVSDARFVPDGSKLVVQSSESIVVIDVHTEATVFSITSADKFALSPDGHTLLATSGAGFVGIWRMSDGKMIGKVKSNTAEAIIASIAPRGKWMVIAGNSGCNGECLFQVWPLEKYLP